MQLNQTLTAAGQTDIVEADGNDLLLVVISEDTATLSVQLELQIGTDWVPVGAPLTAVGSVLLVVPEGRYRADFTGTTIVDCQIGIAT